MATKPNPKRRAKPTVRLPGRPSDIEGEKLLVSAGQMLKSAVSPGQGGVFFLPIDDIIRRKGWITYQDMKHDDQVKATLAFKKILVGGRTWEIMPKDESAKAKEIAEFVQANLERFNFKRAVNGALTAFEYGFSVGEIVWEPAMYNGNRAIMIKDVKHKDPQSLEIAQDEFGNIKAFRQQHVGGQTEVDMDKVWHWAHQSEFGNPYGTSDLRAAYRFWWAKKFVMNFWNVFLERMGQPMTLMKYPQGAGDELKRLLKGILSNLGSKTEVLVPEGVEVELVEATRSGTADYAGALDFYNMSIARALLMVGLIGMGGDKTGRGADSQSRLQLRVLFKMAAEISDDMIFSFMDQVVKKLVDMNFEHDGLYPTFTWQDYGGFEGIEIADTIRQLHVAGLLDLDQTDVNYVRSVLGLPIRGEDDKPDEVLRPEPVPLSGGGAPPPPADQGNARAEKGAGGERKTDPGTTDTRS
jgi:phage gp29-like protein